MDIDEGGGILHYSTVGSRRSWLLLCLLGLPPEMVWCISGEGHFGHKYGVSGSFSRVSGRVDEHGRSCSKSETKFLVYLLTDTYPGGNYRFTRDVVTSCGALSAKERDVEKDEGCA